MILSFSNLKYLKRITNIQMKNWIVDIWLRNKKAIKIGDKNDFFIIMINNKFTFILDLHKKKFGFSSAVNYTIRMFLT